MENKDVLDKIRSEKVRLVEMQFADVIGSVKSVTVPQHKLGEALERGLWFDGSSIEGFTRIFESDMMLRPDISTFRIIPWKSQNGHKTARLICDVYMPDGKPFEGDPRYILRRAVKKAEEMGLKYYVGPELEFFLFKPDGNGKIVPAPQDVAGYFDFPPRDLASEVRMDIIFNLEEVGLEVAYGQHEIDFKYGDAISTADNVMTFKYTVKSIAAAHGLYASFMPKPIFGINGSGMHVHQSLFKDDKNAFYDAKDKYKISETAKHFIAGQLKHARAMSAILAPTVNSYKRLVPGYEAPVYISWGQTNRSALIRIPRIASDRINSTRAELRCPDPSANPYLTFACMLMAGLEGIKSKATAPEPFEESLYELGIAEIEKRGIRTLPGSLIEAVEELQKDALLKETLGKHTYEKFIDAKKEEWDEFRLRVTEWEIERYLEKI